MADSERLPLHTVIKHLTPLLKYHKLDILIPENITSLRNSKNIQFPEMVNKICLDIFKNRNSITPVWLMKNSGRYLPEFLDLRKAKAYFDLCDNSYGSAEASLQPFHRFKLDGIMVFSDFLTILRALGKGFEMDTTRGGYCLNPLVSISELKNLPTVSPSNPVLSSFYNTIFLTRMALKGEAAVIGYVGGPFTLMTYLIEKSSNGLFEFTKKWINTFEKESHQLLDFITDNLFLHIIEQIKSGAQIIQIFEMFSETLTPEDFQLFSYNYIEKLALKIKDSFKNNVPLILYAKGQNPFVKKILKDKREFPFDGVNFDSNCDLDEMAELCEQCNIALIGNLDPGVLMGSNKIIEQKTLRMLKSGKKCGKYIAGLGQGVFEEINPKNVQKFVQCIRNYK